MARLVWLLLFSLAASGCVLSAQGTADFCAFVACGGLGECVVHESGETWCQCYPGALPVGRTCQATCSTLNCGDHGRCIVEGSTVRCLCDPDWVFDGETCLPGGGPDDGGPAAPSDAGADADAEADGGDGAPSPTSLVWRPIAGGSFQMGSTSGLDNEKPLHPVVLPAFAMLESEVTVSQLAECVAAGACVEPRVNDHLCNWDKPEYENHPANCVNWDEAAAYCAWAGGRLPSEAEWEYAARSGGQDALYPWGDDVPSCQRAVFNEQYPARPKAGCLEGRTWAVCSMPEGNTGQGLCDMAGNASEWVQDVYVGTYERAPADGSAWQGPGAARVLRGGHLHDGSSALRATARSSNLASYRHFTVSFRCARTGS